MVANQDETKPETRLPPELALKIRPVRVLRNAAGLDVNPPPGMQETEDEAEFQEEE
jgi:hypothetical protein